MTLLKHSTFAIAGSALLVLTACSDPNDGYQNTRQGLGMGAALGGVLGAIVSDDPGRGAAIGAVAGGMAGGAIGASLDAQARELQNNLGNAGTVDVNGNQMVVTMQNDILFATSSSALSSGARADLRYVSDSLLKYPNSTVKIVGHTDNTGSAAYNQQLSLQRANSVASALVSDGVPARRITATGRGEEEPIATNLTPEGRALNRRVSITIIPNQQ